MTLPASIITIDCQYSVCGKAAAYLIIEGDRAAFVDNNTARAVPHLLQALADNGLAPEQVDYAIITHVHLDHAGGSAALMEACPNATLLAHPKAARHVVDPSRLIQGTKAVYGEELFDALYGEIKGVPEARVRIMNDEEVLEWGGRRLRFFYTLGHASHHFSIYDNQTNSVFTGDAFGIGRTRHCRPGPSFLVCSSSPADFDAAEARVSVEKIVGSGADQAYVAHFGPFTELEDLSEQMLSSIDDHEQILGEAQELSLSGPALIDWCEPRVVRAMEAHLAAAGVDDPAEDLAWLKSDIRLNAQGLAAVAERKRKR